MVWRKSDSNHEILVFTHMTSKCFKASLIEQHLPLDLSRTFVPTHLSLHLNPFNVLGIKKRLTPFFSVNLHYYYDIYIIFTFVTAYCIIIIMQLVLGTLIRNTWLFIPFRTLPLHHIYQYQLKLYQYEALCMDLMNNHLPKLRNLIFHINLL